MCEILNWGRKEHDRAHKAYLTMIISFLELKYPIIANENIVRKRWLLARWSIISEKEVSRICV